MNIVVIKGNTTILEEDIKKNFDAFYSNFHGGRVCRGNLANIDDGINGYCERAGLYYDVQVMTRKEVARIASAHQRMGSGDGAKVAITPFDGMVIVSNEWVELCKKEVEVIRAKILGHIPGKLVFVGMGADHNINDIGNYRIRTYVKNKAGRKFFIELGNGRVSRISPLSSEVIKSEINIDFLVDQDEADYYDKKLQEVCRTPFREMTSSQKAVRDTFLKQPYYQYKQHEAGQFIEGKEANKQNVIDLVNYLFDTNFTEMIVDSVILRLDDYISTDL